MPSPRFPRIQVWMEDLALVAPRLLWMETGGDEQQPPGLYASHGIRAYGTLRSQPHSGVMIHLVAGSASQVAAPFRALCAHETAGGWYLAEEHGYHLLTLGVYWRQDGISARQVRRTIEGLCNDARVDAVDVTFSLARDFSSSAFVRLEEVSGVQPLADRDDFSDTWTQARLDDDDELAAPVPRALSRMPREQIRMRDMPRPEQRSSGPCPFCGGNH